MTTDAYRSFLASKEISNAPCGFAIDRATLPVGMYPYQSDITEWACKRGKSALFGMTGTGKTLMQCAFADQVRSHTSGDVLVVAPLAVAKQTVMEAAKFGIHVGYVRHADEVKSGISITNYEMLDKFESIQWAGIVPDESSILKNFSGKTRNYIIDYAKYIPFNLPCTATPSPNDFMEIGNHAEFLGVMSYTEMLATFFVHDGGETSKWRLKGHAEESFWKWLASWAVFITKPSDLGYSDLGFQLPPLQTVQHIVPSEAQEGSLFAFEVKGLQERQGARRESIERRVAKCAEIVAQSPKPFMIWCGLNAEADALKKAIPGAVEVRGSDNDEYKAQTILDFAAGKIPILISKSSIFGYGMNLQVCCNTAFVGLSDSFEDIFQATKRFHRHGQTKDVTRHIIYSEAEGSVYQNIMRKEADFMVMINNMVQHTKSITMGNIKALSREHDDYNADKNVIIPDWLIGGQDGLTVVGN